MISGSPVSTRPAWVMTLLFVFILPGCESLHNKSASSHQPPPKESSNTTVKPASSGASVGENQVEGTLTVNGKPVSFKYVYAWTARGAFDESKQDVQIVLTDQPVPEAALKSAMGLMGESGTNGIQLRINDEKQVIGAEIYHTALKHGYFSSSGSHVFEPVTFDTNLVEVEVRSDGPRETFGDNWEYNATFKVKVQPGK